MGGGSQEHSSAPQGGADVVGRHRRLGLRTALISSLTLVSRLLGYVREVLAAALFGDRSAVYDAFITAWRVPNLFRRFLGEGALSTSFQTALTRTDGDLGEEAGRRLFQDTARLLTAVLLGLALGVMALVALMPDAMPITGWRWLGADPAPVRDLTVRVMPFVVIVCLSALAAGALQVRGYFAAPSWAPAAMNLVWIGVLVGLVVQFGVGQAEQDSADMARHVQMTRILAWGVLAGGVVQLAVQVPALRRAGFLGVAPPPPAGAPDAWGVLRRSAPLALGAAVYQINVMLDGLMAEGLLPDGGPTLHYYANRVQQFPMALVAVAATSAVFPALQAHGLRGDRRAVRDLHDRTHRAIAFIALPAALGLAVLAGPVISVSFERGAFGAEGVARASAGLRMLTLAILPAGATGLVARTYYAMGDFRWPVTVSVAMLVSNVVLNVLLIEGLHMDVDGLALATAITSWGGLALLLPGLRTRLELPRGREPSLGPLALMTLAALASAGASLAVHSAVSTSVGRGLALLAAIACGVIVYGGVAILLQIPEARTSLARLRRRGRS